MHHHRGMKVVDPKIVVALISHVFEQEHGPLLRFGPRHSGRLELVGLSQEGIRRLYQVLGLFLFFAQHARPLLGKPERGENDRPRHRQGDKDSEPALQAHWYMVRSGELHRQDRKRLEQAVARLRRANSAPEPAAERFNWAHGFGWRRPSRPAIKLAEEIGFSLRGTSAAEVANENRPSQR